MKKQHLFTLDIELIKKLHKKVGRGYRSQFVETAVKNRLENEEAFDLWDVSIEDIYKMARVKAFEEGDTVLHTILTDRLEGLK